MLEQHWSEMSTHLDLKQFRDLRHFIQLQSDKTLEFCVKDWNTKAII